MLPSNPGKIMWFVILNYLHFYVTAKNIVNLAVIVIRIDFNIVELPNSPKSIMWFITIGAINLYNWLAV